MYAFIYDGYLNNVIIDVQSTIKNSIIKTIIVVHVWIKFKRLNKGLYYYHILHNWCYNTTCNVGHGNRRSIIYITQYHHIENNAREDQHDMCMYNYLTISYMVT